MKLVSGNRLWIQTNPILSQYPYLTENTECEVAIIGGGIIGAICAYYFTEAGIDTILVDRNIIGYGSTSASTSILQYEVDYDLTELQAKLGLEQALQGFKLCAQAVNDLEKIISNFKDKCDFSLRECFYYTANKSDVRQMEREYKLRKEQGFAVEFLDHKAAKGRFSFPVEAGIYSSQGAAQIDPYRFVHALLTKATDNGLRIFENTEIIEQKNSGGYVELETNNHKKIQTKKVLIATGYEGRDYFKKRLVSLTRSFTLATKPVKAFTGWYHRCIIRDNESPYTYLRDTGDGRIIIGGQDMKVGGKNSGMAQLKDIEEVVESKYALLEANLNSYFPEISDLEVEYKFNGIFGETKDGLPYIGEHEDYPNYYFCLCYGSNGILYGIQAGQILRDLHLGTKRPELELYKFNR